MSQTSVETTLKRILKILLLCLCLACICQCRPSEVSAAARKGWRTVNGKKYYYVKGKKQKGWKKIKGREYFFSSKGVLQVNKITGNARGGYDYVDKHGIRCREKTIRLAAELVQDLTRPAWSARKKLDACFWYLVNQCMYVADFYDFRLNNFSAIARRMLVNEAGDCYESALAMVFLARVIGYDARLVTGKVSSVYDYPVSVHGWAEVIVNGTYLVYDVTMQRHHSVALHGIPRSAYPFPLAAEHVYRLKVSDNRVYWQAD